MDETWSWRCGSSWYIILPRYMRTVHKLQVLATSAFSCTASTKIQLPPHHVQQLDAVDSPILHWPNNRRRIAFRPSLLERNNQYNHVTCVVGRGHASRKGKGQALDGMARLRPAPRPLDSPYARPLHLCLCIAATYAHGWLSVLRNG